MNQSYCAHHRRQRHQCRGCGSGRAGSCVATVSAEDGVEGGLGGGEEASGLERMSREILNLSRGFYLRCFL